MAFAETANLAVKLTLGGNFNAQLAKTRAGLRGFDKDASRAYKAGGQIGTGIKRSAYIAAGGIAFLTAQVALGLDSLIKLESITAQTEAVLASTGKVAGVSAVQVRKLAESYEAINATVGDELIQNAENLLLTFTNVKSQAFEPALKAALDMNQALGKGPDGLASTVQLLGKALNDPEKGLARLERSTGKFDDATRAAIKTALDQNDTLKAQTLILAALEKKYGGSFAKAGTTTTGKVAKFTDSIEDLQRALATALLPTIGKVADKLAKFLSDPAVIRSVSELGDGIASLFNDKNLDEGGRVLTDVFNAAKAAAPILASAAKAMASVVKTAVDAFTSLPKEIQTLAIGAFAVNKLTGGLVTNIAGGIFGALKAMTVRASIVNVSGGVVNGGGAGGAGVVGGGTSKLVKGLAGLSILADIGAVIATQQAVSGESSDQARGVTETARVYLASSPTTDELATSLAAVDTGIARLQSNPLYVLVQGSALDELRKTRAAIIAQQKNAGSGALGSESRPMNSPTPIVKNTSKTVSAVEAAKAAIAVASKLAVAKAAAQQAKLEATRQAINIGSSSAKSSAGNIAARISASGAATASALRNLPMPIVTTTVNVSVTASGISKTVTTQSRYGPATGSASGDPRFIGYQSGV